MRVVLGVAIRLTAEIGALQLGDVGRCAGDGGFVPRRHGGCPKGDDRPWGTVLGVTLRMMGRETGAGIGAQVTRRG